MRISFMNIEIDNVDLKEAVAAIFNLTRERTGAYVVTPNVDHIDHLPKDEQFLAAYQKAELVLVDGTPVYLASTLYGTPLKEKITGPKLSEAVIKEAADKGMSVFFLGGMPGVAEKAYENLYDKYPGFQLAGTYSPPLGFEKNPKMCMYICELVSSASPDIVITAMGSPKTEVFLKNYADQMEAGVLLSVGAAMDFFAGTKKRCPAWVSRIGMEWFYRFLQEPRRLFKRYFIDDMQYFKLVVKYWPK